MIEEADIQQGLFEMLVEALHLGVVDRFPVRRRHLDVGHAIAIGLLPGFREEQVEVVGNTALAGALLLAGREIQPSGIPKLLQGILLFMLIASDIMTTEVITVKKETTLQELASLLYKHHINGAPVVDDSGALIGIICERTPR